MTLALSALMAAAVQAAPTRTLRSESTPEVGLFTGMWKWLAFWLQENPYTLAKSTSQLDPNGGNH
jgi:hypothetical protein